MVENIKTMSYVSHCNAEGLDIKWWQKRNVEKAQGVVCIQEAIQPPGNNRELQWFSAAKKKKD